MNKKYFHLIFFIALNTLVLVDNTNARMKCWTNSDGVKECGNRVPPEYTQQGYQELSTGGIVKEKTERVKTKEELKKEKIEAREIAREKEKIKIKKAHDRMLLETFANISEIEEVKKHKIEAIESNINITKKRIKKLQNLLDNELDGNSISENADDKEDKSDNIESLKKQILENQNYIEKKIIEQKEVEDTHIKYIARFKELKNLD